MSQIFKRLIRGDMRSRVVATQTTTQGGGVGVGVGSRRGALLYIVIALRIAKGFFR